MMQKLKIVMLLVAGLLFATSCHDYFDSTSPEVDIEQSKKGKKSVTVSEDDDSDRPDWAGGNTGANDHNNKPTPGTMGGSKDYGDLLVIDRDVNGVPVMQEYDVLDEEGIPTGETFWVYQPMYVVAVDDEGLNVYEPIPLDQFGEIPANYSPVEVDFGRLNIVRSPESVLNQALREVLTAIGQGDKFTQDFCGRLSIWNGDVLVKTIDSPRESMAMYREIMRNGGSWGQLSALINSEINPLYLAAASFSAGSDKTGTVDIDEVEYINGFMKIGGDLDYCPDEKEYFNFFNFSYDREFYKDKNIQFLVWDGQYYPDDENGDSDGPVYSVWDVFYNPDFEWKGIGSKPRFTKMNYSPDNVAGFATSVDDAVQVLDFVHGDSNIRYLPD